MDTLEELANWSLRDEDKLGKIVKKITAYKIRYEQLTEESQ